MNHLSAAVQNIFPKKRIVIIGDLVADQFLHGTIARVSREAPVFILRHDETETCAGGAANAAVNVAALGAEPILIGVAGNDANGGLLLRKLQQSGVNCDYIITDSTVKTTTKIRVLAGQHHAARQQVIRIDYENDTEMSTQLRQKLVDNIEGAVPTADAIVISDYNYGVAHIEIFKKTRELAKQRSIPILIDSRFRLLDFPNATTATPNQDEVEHLIGKDFTAEQCSELRARLGFASLLITRGNKGMLLLTEKEPPRLINAVGSLEPVDVTGAGDTVIAVYSLGLASGLSFLEAAEIANHAGGIVVMKKGTASVRASELIESLRTNVKAGVSESSA